MLFIWSHDLSAFSIFFHTLSLFFSKKIESPFESKPKLHRSNSFNRNKKEGDSGKDPNTIFVDYNPQSGVTFRENKNSDVQIVGKGYNDDTSSSDSRSTVNGITNSRTKDRRKVAKGKYIFLHLSHIIINLY